MRLWITLIVIWICVEKTQSGESRTRSLPVRLAGQSYVSLQRWAESNQLSFSRKDEDVKLTNRAIKLSFRLNSLRAEIGEITVFLAHSVLPYQGGVYVTQKDIDRTLKPILWPVKNKSRQTVKVVALSAGHGGKDCGYQMGSQQEKKLNLLLATELEKLIKQAGMKPLLIRNTDKFVDLPDRPKLAKRGGADILLELHHNCANVGNTESRGVECYALTPDGANSTNGGADSYRQPLAGNRQDERNVLLAYQMQKSLVDGAGFVDRGVRRARFWVLRDAEMPAVLIESGFMSHPEEMRKLQTAGYRREVAQAILDGLMAYKRSIERSGAQSKPKS